MKSYSWIILTNCTEGTNQKFEEWYDNVHIPDLLRVPGIVSASRGRTTKVQAIMTDQGAFALTKDTKPDFEYIASYKLQADDPEIILKEVMRRAFTPEMMIIESLSGAQATLFEDNNFASKISK